MGIPPFAVAVARGQVEYLSGATRAMAEAGQVQRRWEGFAPPGGHWVAYPAHVHYRSLVERVIAP